MKILSEKDPLEVFLDASTILNKAVSHTMGPEGSNTAVHFQNYYNIINDGKSIIEMLTTTDPEIAPALETLKQAAFETNRKAGDGTTSTTVITHQLIKGAYEYLKNKPKEDRVLLATRLKNIEKRLQEIIQNKKIEINEEYFEKIAKVSLGSDLNSALIADTFKFLGGTGLPALVKSDIPEIEVEYVDGVNLTKTSVASTMFIDSLPSKELQNVAVVTLFQPIDRFEEITQLCRSLNTRSEPYIILLYNELSNQVLENLLFGLTQNRSKIIPISVKNYGKDMNNILEEVATYVGTSIIDGAGLKVSDISKITPGTSSSVILSPESVIFRKEAVDNEEYKYISKKACIIRIGAPNKITLEDSYKRIEDAVYSVAGAIEYGALKGGFGFPYKYLANTIDDVDIPEFIIESLNYINTEKFNQQYSPDAFDSVLVVSEVIKNSFDIAAQAITTHAIIYDNIR